MAETLFFVVFLGIIVVGVFNSCKDTENQKVLLRGFASDIELDNVRMGKSLFFPALSGSYRGKAIWIEIRPGIRNSPPRLYLQLYTPTRFTLTVYPEGIVQKFGKKIRLIRDLQIDVPDFDEKFVIKTDQPPLAIRFLSSEAVRRTMENLINMGFPSVMIRKDVIKISRQLYDLDTDISREQLKPVLDGLVVLYQAL